MKMKEERKMKMMIRGPVFETNSSSSHTLIHVSKETFEAWKNGEAYLVDRGGNKGKILTGGFYNSTYSEQDFTLKKKLKELKKEGWYGTVLRYKDLLEYYSELGYGHVWKCEANKEHTLDDNCREKISDEEWDSIDDYECVMQEPYMEVIDNGRAVTIHVWGRYE